MTPNLARVNWQLGQTLLPEHLVAQEEALAAEAVLHLRASGLPHHGLAAVAWSEDLLAAGVLSLRTLTAVFPSGALADVPGNARVAPLDLNAPGTAEVSAHLHLLAEPPDADEEAAPASGAIPRRLVPLALSCDPAAAGAVETIRLGLFRKDPDGGWRLSDAHVPPLLQVGASPYLARPLARVLAALDGLEVELLQEAAGALSGPTLADVKACLRGVHRLRRVLRAPQGQVRLHPYQVYEALRDFHVDVCLHRGAPVRHASDVYDHEALARLFDRVVEPLCEQMGVAAFRSPYLPFELREGAWRLDVPREYRGAREVYLLAQKPGAQRAVSLEALKLAAPSRLSIVHRLALKGIPVERVERPVAANLFGPEVEFHAVRPGEEWEHALRDGAVAFYAAPELDGVRFYLYWRMG